MGTRQIGIHLFALICGIAVMAGCARPVIMQAIETDKPHLNVTFALKPDFYPKAFGIIACRPQMAVWIEAPDLGSRETLYVTYRGAKNDWIYASERPSALPVWYGIEQDTATDVDAVSGATPSGESFTVAWQVPNRFWGKKVNVFIEANVSFDYNAFYSDTAESGEPGYSDVNGQPSVIWRAELDLSQNEQSVTPEIVGHGHVLGTDYEIQDDLEMITTAKELFDSIKIDYYSGSTDINSLYRESKSGDSLAP